jgi:O-antigen/teichoic acid export membrane protein
MTEDVVQAVSLPDSIRYRYLATLLARFVQLGASAIAITVVPRALGPAAYGSYAFLLTTAATVRGFIDLSAYDAFFTFSSQERRSGALTKLYVVCLGSQLALTLLLVGVGFATGTAGWLWLAEPPDRIVWLTILDWLIFVGIALQSLGDSKALTVRTQVIGTAVAGLNVAALLLLNALGDLDFYTYVWVNVGSSLVLCVALAWWLFTIKRDECWIGRLFESAPRYLARWWRYARPMVVVSLHGHASVWFSAYVLQRAYGSSEQAYFALASRWSLLALTFVGAAMPIFWREVSKAVAGSDHVRAAEVYARFSQTLFFLAFVLSCWLSLASRSLVEWLAGPDYLAAAPVLMVMAFYPVVQTIGQLNDSALKATERTVQLRNLRLGLAVPDLLVTYFTVAPSTARVPGLGLGAIGVAAQLVGWGLLSRQVYEWTNSRFFGQSYLRGLRDRLVAVAVVGSCAVAILAGVSDWFQVGLGWGAIGGLSAASVLYFALMGILVVLWPGLAGVGSVGFMLRGGGRERGERVERG